MPLTPSPLPSGRAIREDSERVTTECPRPEDYLRCSVTVRALLVAVVVVLGAELCSIAATITWDGNGSNSNSAWISTTNWNPDSTLRTGGAPTSTDIAEFAGVGLAASIGINFNGATNNGTAAQIVGQILQSGGASRTIGSSTTIVDGVLTIAGVGGVLIANTSSNSLTLAPNVGAGTKLMQVQFGSVGNIDVTGSGLVTISSVMGGSNGFVKTGSGQLDLTGINTHTGVTTLREGTLRVTSITSLGALPGSPTTTVILEGGTLITDVSSSSGANRGFALGPISGSGSATIEVPSTRSVTIGGIIANNGAGTGALIKTGGGTLALTGTNTYTGSTTVLGGTLSVDAGTSMGAAPSSPTPGFLTLNGGTLVSTNTFALSSNRGIGIGTAGGTISPQSATTLTYGGVIADSGGPGALTMGGAGTLILTGTNTYTGGTTVNGGGVLQVGNGGTGTTGVGAVSVSTGSTIFGSGTLRGNSSVTHTFAGAVRPGDQSTGATPMANLKVEGNLTFTPVSSTFFEIGNPASSYDRITGTVAGTSATLDGTIKVDFSSYTPTGGESWRLFDWTSLVTTGFNSGTSLRTGADGVDEGDLDLPDVSALSLRWDLSGFASSGTISLTVIPEPRLSMLLGLGMLLLGGKRVRGK